MANRFQILIGATDNATAKIKKINEGMAKITRPISQMKRSVAAFSRESGLTRMGKSMAHVGRAAGNVARQIGSIAAPLTAIIGIGSLAAMSELAVSWGRLGFEIGRTAALIGISTTKLQELRGAAAVMGISSQELTGGIKSLGDTLEDAFAGRNQQALMMLSQLGIRMHRTKAGAVDTARAFKDLSHAISSRSNPQAQALIARTFGLSAVLPLLQKGPAAIEAYEAKVRSLGGVLSGSAVAAAQRFGMSMNYLKVSLGGLKNAISAKLLPVIQPFIDQLTAWISANRKLIATKVTAFVERLAHALAQINWGRVVRGIEGFFAGAAKLWRMLGGLKGIMTIFAVIMGIKVVSALAQVATGIAVVATALTGLEIVAAPVLATILALGAAIAALAVAQHKLSGDMQDPRLKSIMPKHPQSTFGYLGSLLGGPARGHGLPPLPADTRVQPQYVGASGSWDEEDAPHASAWIGSRAPDSQKVQMEVLFKNAPHGTTATAKTSDGKRVPVRIGYAMPEH